MTKRRAGDAALRKEITRLGKLVTTNAEAEARGYARGLEDLPIWFRRGVEAGFERVKTVMEGREIGPFILKELEIWRSIGAMKYIAEEGKPDKKRRSK